MFSLKFALFPFLLGFEFNVDENGKFEIVGDRGVRIDSGSYMVAGKEQTYTTNKTLNVTEDTDLRTYGKDVIGYYDEYHYTMKTGDVHADMETYIRYYYGRDTVIFGQKFGENWSGKVEPDRLRVSTSFPSIKVPSSSNMTYINPCKEGTSFPAKGTLCLKKLLNSLFHY